MDNFDVLASRARFRATISPLCFCDVPRVLSEVIDVGFVGCNARNRGRRLFLHFACQKGDFTGHADQLIPRIFCRTGRYATEGRRSCFRTFAFCSKRMRVSYTHSHAIKRSRSLDVRGSFSGDVTGTSAQRNASLRPASQVRRGFARMREIGAGCETRRGVTSIGLAAEFAWDAKCF